MLNPNGNDACKVIGLTGASGGYNGQKQRETSRPPWAVFLVSKRSLIKFWGMSGLAPLDREGQTSRDTA